MLGSLLCGRPCCQSCQDWHWQAGILGASLASVADTLNSVLHAQAYSTLSTTFKRALYDQ